MINKDKRQYCFTCKRLSDMTINECEIMDDTVIVNVICEHCGSLIGTDIEFGLRDETFPKKRKKRKSKKGGEKK